jgi:O-antigen/teichoic acid export membrane protein
MPTGDKSRKSIREMAGWTFIGRMLNFLLQAVYFVLLARLLRVDEYGVFAGVFAIVSTLTPYSALGAAMLFMRYLAVDHSEAPTYWGNSLITTTGFTSFFCLVSAVAGFALHLYAHPLMIVLLLVANCFFLQITILGSMMTFSLGDARMSAIMTLVTNLSRTIVLVIMKVVMGHANALQWSAGVVLSSAVPAVLVLYQMRRRLGPARFDLKLLRRRMLEGLGFSFAGTTEAVNNDLDKVMLSHYGMFVQNGFYTLAYRIIDFATSPIGSLTAAVMQRHFVLSHEGVRAMLRLVGKSLFVAIAFGLFTAAAIRLTSPYVPYMAGRDFSGAVAVLSMLCWLPLIRGVQQMTGSAVTGLGHQGYRTIAQLSAALLNVGLNVMWIPKFGWHGAAWSTLACDGLLMGLNTALMIVIVKRALRKEGTSEPQYS